MNKPASSKKSKVMEHFLFMLNLMILTALCLILPSCSFFDSYDGDDIDREVYLQNKREAEILKAFSSGQYLSPESYMTVTGSYSGPFSSGQRTILPSTELSDQAGTYIFAKLKNTDTKTSEAQVSLDGNFILDIPAAGTWEFHARIGSTTFGPLAITFPDGSPSSKEFNTTSTSRRTSGITLTYAPSTTSGHGSLDLNVSLPANDSNGYVATIMATLQGKNSSGAAQTYTATIPVTGTTGCRIIAGKETATFQNATSLAAGSWTLTLAFYDSSTPQPRLKYHLMETVNIYNGFTSTLLQGSSEYIDNSTSTSQILVTRDMTESFARTTLYVRGIGASSFPAYVSDASDSNEGTFFAPLATIQKAVDKILAINDGLREYKVFVDGTVNCATSSPALYITSLGKNLTLSISGLDSSHPVNINGNSSTGIIKVDETSKNVNMTISNMLMQSSSDVAIGFRGKGPLYSSITLNNVHIFDCGQNTTSNAGAIHLYNAKCTLEGSTVIGKDSNFTVSSSTNSNKGTQAGAIYAAFAIVEMKDTSKVCGNWLLNQQNTYGSGGIYLNASTLYMQDNAVIKNNGMNAYNPDHTAGGKNTGKNVRTAGSECTIFLSDNACIYPDGDVCLDDGVTITLASNITAAPNALLYPINLADGRQVIQVDSGISLADNVGRFSLVDDSWYITKNGTLKTCGELSDLVSMTSSLKSGDVRSLELTKAITKSLTSGTIDGVDCDASAMINVPADASLTIRGDPSNRTIINIDFNAKNAYLIKVRKGATLTLENITIQGCNRFAPILVYGGTVILKNCLITGTNPNNVTTDSADFIYISNGGSVTMDGGEMSGNGRNNGSSTTKYGISINNGCTFTMKNGAVIKDSILSNREGVEPATILLKTGGTFTMESGSSLSQSTPGDAIYIQSGGIFNQNGCTVTGNIRR